MNRNAFSALAAIISLVPSFSAMAQNPTASINVDGFRYYDCMIQNPAEPIKLIMWFRSDKIGSTPLLIKISDDKSDFIGSMNKKFEPEQYIVKKQGDRYLRVTLLDEAESGGLRPFADMSFRLNRKGETSSSLVAHRLTREGDNGAEPVAFSGQCNILSGGLAFMQMLKEGGR